MEIQERFLLRKRGPRGAAKQALVMATKKSKFKLGDRVWFTYAGRRFKQEGSVEHVRKDGLLIVHFDADRREQSWSFSLQN